MKGHENKKKYPIPMTDHGEKMARNSWVVARIYIVGSLVVLEMEVRVRRNGVHLSHSRQMAHVYYQLFDSKMADGDQLWSVPKLEYDLLCRNASTNGQKTDLIERYILHRKPKHAIYVRYFSISLYLLNVQVAPTENKTS